MTEAVTMAWLMDASVDANAQMSLAKMTVAVGATSEAHRHSNCDETIHLLQGMISQRIGDEWREMVAGETCLITRNTAHQTRNIGPQPAVMMVAYSAGRRDYEALTSEG